MNSDLNITSESNTEDNQKIKRSTLSNKIMNKRFEIDL